MGFHARELAHHAFEFFLQDFSRGRERHPLGSAVEHRHAQLVLEFGDLPADCRWRNMKPLRGGADRTRMRGLAEVSKGCEIHGFPRCLECVLLSRQQHDAEIDLVSMRLWVNHVSRKCNPTKGDRSWLSCTCCPTWA